VGDAIRNALPGILENLPVFPDQASSVASRVDLLTFIWVAVSLFFSLLIAGLVVFFGVRYHRRSPTAIGEPIHRTTAVELATMSVPFVVAMAMFAWGAYVYVDLRRPPTDAVEYFVFGKQWMWKYQHPNGLREINNLTVPVSTPIKLTMTSEDVIHSFFVPDFRIKQDVVPGRYTTTWFEATRTGVFRQFCAEYCGTQHSLMGGRVTVVERDQYDAFLESGGVTTTMGPSSGEELFASLACVTCHQEPDAGRGPSLRGLLGNRVELASGETVIADESYVRESILDPTAKVVKGYMPLMPTFAGQVSEEQIAKLIEYIRSLSTESAAQLDGAESGDSGG
jgi:cytochrome c oxidase subunit 2